MQAWTSIYQKFNDCVGAQNFFSKKMWKKF